jgi:NADH:ubiquinone oxidoreductase subunit K
MSEIGLNALPDRQPDRVLWLGLYCVLTRRNAIGILMGVELILNAANINYLAFARYSSGSTTARCSPSS